jgi:hypothetical protein
MGPALTRGKTRHRSPALEESPSPAAFRYHRAMRPLATLLGIGMLTAGPASAEVRHNHCEFVVSGDATASVKADVESTTSNGKVMAGTDYWSSEAELRRTLQAVGGPSKTSDAERQRKIDEQMKKDPRLTILLINCLTDDGGVIVVASPLSKYADVPMKPATYKIASQGADRAGEFSAKVRINIGGKRQGYDVLSGKLVLGQFDKKGLAGTFALEAQDHGTPPKQVEVTGKFSYACAGDACQK